MLLETRCGHWLGFWEGPQYLPPSPNYFELGFSLVLCDPRTTDYLPIPLGYTSCEIGSTDVLPVCCTSKVSSRMFSTREAVHPGTMAEFHISPTLL